MSVGTTASDMMNATVPTVFEITSAFNQTGNDTAAGKTMLDLDWLNNDLENLTTSFNSTGNETIDGRTMFYFPGMTHNIPPMDEEHATSFMIILILIVFMVLCAAIYKFWVLPNRRTRATDTDTESKFRLMENNENGEESPNAYDDDQDPLLPRQASRNKELFQISERVELGMMAKMFFNRYGIILFYACMVIYLYGDLAIYAVAVPKNVVSILCNNLTCRPNMTLPDNNLNLPCTPGFHSKFLERSSRRTVYHMVLGVFIGILGPFAFFDVSKTKLLQLVTSLVRWISFLSMIILAIMRIANGNSVTPVVADISAVPNLFGVAVYSFMCQHSLPALLTPISRKSKLTKMLTGDFLLVLTFYMLLCITAAFCFDHKTIQDLYTLNFLLDCQVCSSDFLRYFLALFPVLTLSTSFPIITVTLRNNLRSLFAMDDDQRLVWKIFFPILAMGPPIILAFFTDNLESLVGITGSYAGAGIQYVIPVALVYYARKSVAALDPQAKNPHRLRINSNWTIIVVLIWTVLAISFVTYNHIVD
ncbi:Oidioi.mRNA.OKI2018_I69.chr2.g7845.t1.cds [Oikopleura dioica]|uniref:Oidioi.mRNA.OKI2018_I69.chr2.g7845.t1.cds n=1 Tax=Oikopleura dioica TaxID=34765 RepID=A0ABN7TC82_OIKDI|nr:Oidioi.mRNA.OKI2018_I69.chr2.g7845.t1.cds [Oikopleura dioica]